MKYKIYKKKFKKLFYRLKGNYSFKLEKKFYRCDTNHIRFWKKFKNKKWEPQTFKILDKYLTVNSIYCDIGAWIGPTVLYSAKRCKKIYCFEPDIVAYKDLLFNICANNIGKILPFNIALSDKNAILKMSSKEENLGESTSSLLNKNDKNSIEVLSLKWENWLNIVKPPKIDFIKIDIEGSEFSLLPTMKEYLKKYKPIIYLSTHAPFLEKDMREEKVKELFDTLKIYNKCLDEHFVEMKIDSNLLDYNINNCSSCIFLD